MATRSNRLFIGRVAAGTTATLYTCPAGVIAVVKDWHVNGSSTGLIQMTVRLSGGSTDFTILVTGSTTSTGSDHRLAFLCLRSGDVVKLTAPAGGSVDVALSGAELVL